MTQSSCKRDTKSKSHRGMKLAPVRVFSCKHPLKQKITADFIKLIYGQILGNKVHISILIMLYFFTTHKNFMLCDFVWHFLAGGF